MKRKEAGHDPGEDDLENQLQPPADAVGFLLDDLQVVIDEPKHTEIDHAEKDEPNERVIRPRPDDRRDNDRADDEHAAHRRRACFAAMQLGQVPHLGRSRIGCPTFSEINFPDDVVAEEKRNREGGDGRQDRAERDVIENIEALELLRQAMQEKHHDAQPVSIWRFANSSSTRSVRAAAAAFDEDEITRVRLLAEQLGRFLGRGDHPAVR